MASDPGKYINSKQETFSVLCNMKVLYDGLSERWQEEFLDSLNQNPVGKIIEDEGLTYDMIRKFDHFEGHFCYTPLTEQKRVYVVKKSSVPEIFQNLKACVQNDIWTDKCYKMN